MNVSFDFRTLEITASVIESGSMSETGHRLGLTQSAVSQAVQRAEAIIGAPLLRRNRRPLLPTNAGLELSRHVRDILQRAESVIESVRLAAAVPERHDLRLGLADSFAATVGPFLVKELLAAASSLRLTAWAGLAYSHTEALLRHGVDAIVTPDTNQDYDKFERYRLFSEPYLLVVQKGKGEAVRTQSLGEILGANTLIRHSARSHAGKQIEIHLRRRKLEPPSVLEFDTSDALVAMVATGIGVAITTPLCLLQGAVHIDELDVLPLPGPKFSREIVLLTHRGEFLTAGPRIASLSRSLMKTNIIPKLLVIAPWLVSQSEEMILDGEK